MPVLQVQRRMMELGRIRLGEKGPKGEPRRLTTFRLTSASKMLLDDVADTYGGTVRPWTTAPDEGYFEVTSEATELDIVLPPTFSTVDGTPTTAYSQWFELWSGDGCQRRCDGETETLTNKPCLCDPDARACKVTTRVSVMLPRIRGLGVWRLESHGWNAATVLPGTLELLAQAANGGGIKAILRLEQRTSKKGGETHKFVVPVIDVPDFRLEDMLDGGNMLAINAPQPNPPKPALPAAEVVPESEPFANEQDPGFGEPPSLPANDGDEAGAAREGEAHPSRITRLRNLALEKGAAKTEAEVDQIISNHMASTGLGYLDKEWVAAQVKLLESMEVPA